MKSFLQSWRLFVLVWSLLLTPQAAFVHGLSHTLPQPASANGAAGDESLRPRGWPGHVWSPAIGAEHRACRESAAMFDETSFGKIEVAGPGALGFHA